MHSCIKKTYTISPKLICEEHQNSNFKDSCGYGLTLQASQLEERQSMMKLSYEDIGIRNGDANRFGPYLNQYRSKSDDPGNVENHPVAAFQGGQDRWISVDIRSHLA